MAADLGRLRWRCRRGMKELDILLTRYLDERYGAAAAEEQQAFQQLLESQDPFIFAYCLGTERPPEHLAGLIERIAGSPSGANADRYR
jgi:antitoxin CptB